MRIIARARAQLTRDAKVRPHVRCVCARRARTVDGWLRWPFRRSSDFPFPSFFAARNCAGLCARTRGTMVQGKLIGQVISAKMQQSVVVKVPYWHVVQRLQVR